MEIHRVEGKEKGKIMVYALSTCMWCRKTKSLLSKMGVAYSFVDVDMLDAGERDYVKAEIRRWNPQGSYPTIVIDEERCISGFDETEIREALGDV